MSVKVYDVDEAILNQRPRVKLRKVLYPIRDMTIENRIRLLRECFEEEQAALQLERTDPVAAATAIEALIAKTVDNILDGVPAEVLSTITELEFQAIQRIVISKREVELTIEAKNVEGAEM